MRFQRLTSNLRLILLGVGLGLIARWMLGPPETPTGQEKVFNSPIDETVTESSFNELPDFPLIEFDRGREPK